MTELLKPLNLLVPKLYLLTNDDKLPVLLAKLEMALATGVVHLLQIRRKQVLATDNGAAKLYQEALQIVALAKRYKVAVVINDDMALAEQLGVGVHLGQSDGSIEAARQRLGCQQVIGRTCHDDVDLVVKAKSAGASYAAMGAIFSSTTKPNAQPIERSKLIAGCKQDIDICVIGGLTAENITGLQGLPIRYVAVVGDIMDLSVDKIAHRCQQWQQALNTWSTASSK